MSIVPTPRVITRAPDAISEEEKREALSPETSQARLQELFEADASLDFCLVQNPNLPFELLLKLAAKHTLQAIENPSLALRLLEDPAALMQFLSKTLSVLVELESLPAWLTDAMWERMNHAIAASSPKIAAHWLPRLLEAKVSLHGMTDYLWSVARHPKISVAQMEALAVHPSEKVRSALASNENLPLSLVDVLRRDSAQGARLHIARREDVPVEWLEELAEDEELPIRSAVAENSKTSTKALETIARHKKNDARIREALAKHREAPASLLEQYLQGAEEDAVRAAFANPNLPLETAFAMCRDEKDPERSLDYWAMLARNPALPSSMLWELAKHPDCGIRCGIAMNLGAPVALLAALADDEEEDVRELIAENPNTPRALLLRLRDDPASFTSDIASKRLREMDKAG